MNFVAFGCSEVIMQKNTAFRENHTVLRPKMIERWICKTTSGQVVGKFNFCSSWTEVKKDFAATFGEVPYSILSQVGTRLDINQFAHHDFLCLRSQHIHVLYPCYLLCSLVRCGIRFQ